MFDFPFLFGGDNSGYTPDFGLANEGSFPTPALPDQIAQHLAMQGVKPAEFMANPQAFAGGAAGIPFPPMNPGASMKPAFSFDQPIVPTPVRTLSYQAPPGGESSDVLETGGRSTAPATAGGTPTNIQPPGTAEEMSAKSGQGNVAQNLTNTLKGVQAMQPPQPQRVYTPNPVNPGHSVAGAVKGGQLAALLSLLAGKQGTPQVPLPLGAVLAGRT